MDSTHGRRSFLTWMCALAALVSMPAVADFPDIVAQVKSSVVAVGTFQPTRNPQFKFRGTGFIAGNGNLVVTNAHVLGDPLDNNESFVIGVPAQGRVTVRPVVKQASDPDHDLLVLRFEGQPLPALKLADSNAVREGQDIAFTGFPLGATLGVVAATNRGIVSAITPVGQPAVSASQLDARSVRRLASGTYAVFQIDAVSYPGNSGSPLYDYHTGEVIGVMNMVFIKGLKESALSSPSGISYAIPSQYIKVLLTQ